MLIKRPSILEGLHGCSALTMFPLIGSFGIVVLHECIKIDLDFLNGFVYLFSESNFVELILNNLVQPFGRSVGLRMSHLSPGMLDSIQMQKQLVGVSFDASTVLSTRMLIRE